MIQKYPESKTSSVDTLYRANLFSKIKNLIVRIRTIRATYHIDPIKKVTITLIAPDTEFITNQTEIIKKLARVEMIHILTDGASVPDQCAYSLSGDIKLYVHLEGILDVEKEKARLQKELEQTESYVARLKEKLNNSNFTDKAPVALVAQTQTELKNSEGKAEEIKHHLANLV
jgi:valyl-tRNA synthetase